MEEQEPFNQEKNKTSNIEILKRASENIDNKNMIQRYRAIRQISGSINCNADLLDWLVDNHNDLLEDVAAKLQLLIKNENDSVMISEAVRSLELIESHINMQEPVISANLICKNCQCTIQQGWKHCPGCGQDLQKIYCTKCGDKLDSSWNICPKCGNHQISILI